MKLETLKQENKELKNAIKQTYDYLINEVKPFYQDKDGYLIKDGYDAELELDLEEKIKKYKIV